MKKKIVLTGAVRTPIGKFGGSLADVSAAELAAVVISEALKRAGVAPGEVDEVLIGCVLQAGQGQNISRQAAINAGIPAEVPAMTLNNVCGSGLKAVNLAADMIAAGSADIVVAGGAENMSSAGYYLDRARFGYRMGNGNLIDTMINDALTDGFERCHMGVIVERMAEEYGISRELQDEFAAKSQQKCQVAQNDGIFREEITPVPIRYKKEMIKFDKDEYPRPDVTVESLAKLKPAFKSDGGTVTAGNASGINDGAAAIVVMSEEKALELGVEPMAVFVTGESAGVKPSVMGIGPVFSTRKALAKADMCIGDIDLIEANEAFAVQALTVGALLEWEDSIVNVNGGAIALGHPVGASGCRILVTLLHEMKRRRAKTGLATLCVGGGMGVSTIVRNFES